MPRNRVSLICARLQNRDSGRKYIDRSATSKIVSLRIGRRLGFFYAAVLMPLLHLLESWWRARVHLWPRWACLMCGSFERFQFWRQCAEQVQEFIWANANGVELMFIRWDKRHAKTDQFDSSLFFNLWFRLTFLSTVLNMYRLLHYNEYMVGNFRDR